MADVTVKWYGDKVVSQAQAACQAALTLIANDIIKEARRLMDLPKSGRDYRTAKQQREGAKRSKRVDARRTAKAAGKQTSRVVRRG